MVPMVPSPSISYGNNWPTNNANPSATRTKPHFKDCKGELSLFPGCKYKNCTCSSILPLSIILRRMRLSEITFITNAIAKNTVPVINTAVKSIMVVLSVDISLTIAVDSTNLKMLQ